MLISAFFSVTVIGALPGMIDVDPGTDSGAIPSGCCASPFTIAAVTSSGAAIPASAPVLIQTDKIDPIEIAIEEFEKGVIPITVKREK